jgi:large subunit ribosomal protein L19e
MDLIKKKKLAMRLYKVGSDRVLFMNSRLNDIKEAITKQDIRDLVKDGAIIIKEVKGRSKNKKKKKIRSVGNVRKKINTRKRDYMNLTRKLRSYVDFLKENGKITKEERKELRKRIRTKEFKSKSNLKEHMEEILRK